MVRKGNDEETKSNSGTENVSADLLNEKPTTRGEKSGGKTDDFVYFQLQTRYNHLHLKSLLIVNI